MKNDNTDARRALRAPYMAEFNEFDRQINRLRREYRKESLETFLSDANWDSRQTLMAELKKVYKRDRKRLKITKRRLVEQMKQAERDAGF